MIRKKTYLLLELNHGIYPLVAIKKHCNRVCKNNQVIYVNVPLDRKNYLKRTHTNLNDLRREYLY
jgi:RecA-family ATPase